MFVHVEFCARLWSMLLIFKEINNDGTVFQAQHEIQKFT